MRRYINFINSKACGREVRGWVRVQVGGTNTGVYDVSGSGSGSSTSFLDRGRVPVLRLSVCLSVRRWVCVPVCSYVWMTVGSRVCRYVGRQVCRYVAH